MAIRKKNASSERERRRVRRHRRVRKKIMGTAERPRLVVHRSSKHMQGQIVDDVAGTVLVGISMQLSDLQTRKGSDGLKKSDLGKEAGKLLAQRAKEAGVTKVVFDRGGYIYHGKVKAIADAAREQGLQF